MSDDDDDKPTVVLDLNALKKQTLKQEEDLANMAQDLEFAVGPLDAATPAEDTKPQATQPEPGPRKNQYTVILFDFNSDFYQKSKSQFPGGYDYKIAKNLPELNKFLSAKSFQIVAFNYDVNPKAVNQLCAQIKLKFPSTKTLIMAKSISPEKAKLHAKTPSGANGYYQFPLDAQKIEAEFLKIHQSVK